MGDVSTIQRTPGTAAKGDHVGELVSAGWTNDSHNMYISSMEASFMQQLRGQHHHHAAPDRSITHVAGGHGLKSHQEGASDNLGAERNVPRSRDVAARGLPEDPWARRFKPRDSAMNRRGDGVGASDGESGTDTVHAMAPKHGRGASSCVGGNLADKSSEVSGQNFPEDEVHSAAQPSKSCKKRRPASSTAAGSFISMLGDKRW